MKVRSFLLFLLVLAATPLSALAGDDIPSWMRRAAGQSIPTYDKKVSAVALYQEQQLTMGSDGKIVTIENQAVKILDREGRRYAFATAFYLVSAGKVRNLTAWLIRPDGTTKTYDSKTIIDLASDPEDIYNEYRIKLINGKADVDVGSVFGYTIESEESPLFYQDSYAFQNEIPTLLSRYSLTLPSGWSATSTTFNAPELKPAVNGSTYVWEMRGLSRIPDEPMSPSTANLSPRIVVNYAPDGSKQQGTRTFDSWTDVSRWATAMHDPAVIVDDAVAGKARDLIVNAKTEFEQIRAIATFVQNLQYISIDIGVGYGNGYRPRSSALVLSRGYGDCKDKANLMRAMLRSLKIDAYPIAIYSGDPTFVRDAWPSPKQFNHCIIAIKVSDETKAPTVITDAKLGRLLIFDATDPYTPVGDLPDYLQGSYAVVIAGDRGGLIKMPLTSPEINLLERTVDVTISPDGGIKGKIKEHATGQTSTYFRAQVRLLSSADYRKVLESWLTRGATAARMDEFRTTDRSDETAFDLDVNFSAPTYGQLMQGRLLVFKPAIVSRHNDVYLTEAKRINPVEIDRAAVKEMATFTLPAGFVVDEMPDPVALDTPFGKYSTQYQVKDGKLIFTRSLALNRMVVPVDKYDSVKAFFSQMRDAEQSPVVLLKK